MSPRDRILSPYTRRVDDAQHRIVKLIGVTALIFLAMVLGFFIGIFGLPGWYIPAIPVVFLLGISGWLAPDVDTDLNKPITTTLLVYLVVLLIWPRYIAFNAPGLPWVSLQRLAMAILVLLFCYAFSTSSRVRRHMADVLQSQPRMSQIFMAWVLIHFLMLFVGRLNGFSNWINQTLIWNFAFLSAAYVGSLEGVALKAFRIIIMAAVVTSAIVIPEVHLNRPIWADSIPAFLAVDPEIVQLIAEGRQRIGEYRAISIFAESVSYAEFVGMMVPFTMLAIVRAPNSARMVLAIAAFILLFTAGLLTQSRTAMVGFIVGILAFFAIWVVRRYHKTYVQRDIIAPALLYSLPAIALSTLLVILSSTTLTRRVFGGGEHAASNDGRIAQWEMAMPKILSNPFGYGVGTISEVVPYVNLANVFTIDSYPINLLIEFGVAGFLLFVCFFVFAIVLGIRMFFSGATVEQQVAGAAACSLISFLTSRTVLSTNGSQPFAFLLAGLILGLWWRHQQALSRVEPADSKSGGANFIGAGSGKPSLV